MIEQQIFSIIHSIVGEEELKDQYCFCGSGIRYKKCCHKQLHAPWFSKDLNDKAKGYEGFYMKKIEDAIWTKTCIEPHCNKQAIQSHYLLSRSKLGNEFGKTLLKKVIDVFFKKNHELVGYNQSSKAKKHLRCSDCDQKFHKIDDEHLDINRIDNDWLFLQNYRILGWQFQEYVALQKKIFSSICFNGFLMLDNLSSEESKNYLREKYLKYNSFCKLFYSFSCIHHNGQIVEMMHRIWNTKLDIGVVHGSIDLPKNISDQAIHDWAQDIKENHPLFIYIFPQQQELWLMFSWLPEDSLLYEDHITGLTTSPTIEEFVNLMKGFGIEGLDVVELPNGKKVINFDTKNLVK